MDWNAVALALEAKAESVGLNALDYVPDSLPNSAFYVGEMDIEPNQTFNKVREDGSRIGTDQATITCRVLIARSTDKFAIRKMRTYSAGSGMASLIQAIQSDPTLDGTVDACKVISIRGNRLFTVGADAKFYGTEFDIFVIGQA